MIRLRVLAALLLTAARWHLRMAPTRLGYWARPYCWRLDRRHGRRAHQRCLHQHVELTLAAARLR